MSDSAFAGPLWSPPLDELVGVLWEFLAVSEAPTPADVVFVFGSQDLRVPAHAAALHRAGHAPVVLVTGAYGRMSRDRFDRPEALVFKERLVRAGVPPAAVVTEPTARNTLENVTRGLDALRRRPVPVTSALLVAKPFVMRRCAATFARQAPEVRVRCCPPPGDLASSIDRAPPAFAARLVGELERLDRYATAGDIAPQDVPAAVRVAARQMADYVPRADPAPGV